MDYIELTLLKTVLETRLHLQKPKPQKSGKSLLPEGPMLKEMP